MALARGAGFQAQERAAAKIGRLKVAGRRALAWQAGCLVQVRQALAALLLQ
jgi:hypothetical protein